MSDSSFAVLSQHYTIRILRKSWEIATVLNDTSTVSFRHHALQPAGLRQLATAHGAEWLFTNVCHRPTYDVGSVMFDFYILLIKSKYCNFFTL